MKELLGNPLILITLLAIILLILPSPLIKKTDINLDDLIKEVAEKKAKDMAYKVLTDFAERLKNSEHNGNINLISNNQIDRELNRYKISLDLTQLKKAEETLFKIKDIDYNIKKSSL